jgi:NAD(P)-dependent dehydrogenase (short-subunit alcohol dehydrogenase family)
MKFQGQMAMVTGAGSGIGRATACMLAARGATVAVIDIDGASAQETVRLIAAAGGHGAAYAADTSKAADLDSTMTSAVRDLGPLRIMFNNAGGSTRCSRRTTRSDWRRRSKPATPLASTSTPRASR